MTKLATFARRVTKYLLSKTGGATKQALLQRRNILKKTIGKNYSGLNRTQRDSFIAKRLGENRTYRSIIQDPKFKENADLYNAATISRPASMPGNLTQRGLVDRRSKKLKLNKAGKTRLAQLEVNLDNRKNERAKELVTEIMDVFKKRVDKNLPKMKRVNSPVSKRLLVSKEVKKSTDFRGKGRKPAAELAFTSKRRTAKPLVYYQPIPSKKYEIPKSRTSLQQPPLSPGLLPPLSEEQIKAAAKRSGVDQIKVNISPENPATRRLPKSTTNISTSRSTASNKDRGNTNNIGNTLLSLAGLGSGGYLLAHSINRLNKRRRRRFI